MDALDLLVSLAVPWFAGTALVQAGRGREARPTALDLGYGYFAGMLVLTLLAHGIDLLHVPLTPWSLGAPLAIIGSGAVLVARRRAASRAPRDAPAGTLARWLLMAVALALAVRIGTLGIEVLLRPLFPWDAWTQWATKARVWSSLHALAPFVDSGEWLAHPGAAYTDSAPHYPGTVPLQQAWTAIVLGRWNDALVNVPWLAAAVALALGVYGQLREEGVGIGWSAVATYLVLSLPMLDVHVALAGYADLHVGAVFALGLLALCRFEAGGGRFQLGLLALALALLPWLKIPGVAWAGALVTGLVVVAARRQGRARLIGLGAALLAVAGLALLRLAAKISFVSAAPSQENIAASLATQLLAFDSWHLLWYAVPIVAALAWRDAIARFRGATVAVVLGFAFLLWTFFLTRAADWVVDYTTVNRALLHVAPGTTAFACLLLWNWARRHDSAPRAAGQAP